MTCHITRNSTRITCTRLDGGAEAVMLREYKDAHRYDDEALSMSAKPLALKLLAREQAKERLAPRSRACALGPYTGPLVAWLNWVHAKKPGGGANALEEILRSMQRRGVAVVGIEIARNDGGNIQPLIDFYKERGFRVDTSFASAQPVMLRELR